MRLVLLSLQRARFAQDLLTELEGWLDVLRAVDADPGYAEDSRSVFWYLYKVTDVAPAEIRALLDRERATRLKDMALTTAEKLDLEGATRGKRELLRKLVAVRFGHLPASVAARLEAAQEAELDLWAERVLTATRAEDVVAE